MKKLKSLKLNLFYIYGYYFFRSFIFAYVIERLFWKSRGISITDTVYLEFVYAIVTVITELPSGVLADRLSRTLIVRISALINFLSALLMIYAYGFWMFAIAISLSAVYGAFSSGSVNALVYDGLKELHQEDTFEKCLGRIKAIRYTSGLIAALIGALIAQHISLEANYYLSAISSFIGFVLTLMLTEPSKKLSDSDLLDTDNTSEENGSSILDIIRISYKLLKTNLSLVVVMFYGAVIGSMIIYFEEFWQNYAELLKIQPVYFGIISALISLTVIIASVYSDKIINFIKSFTQKVNKTYSILLGLMGFGFILVGNVKSLSMIIVIAIASGIAAISENMLLGDIHKLVTSDVRATVESVYSMFHRVLSIIVGLLFAYLSDKVDVSYGFMGIGYFSIVFMLVLRVIQITIKNKGNMTHINIENDVKPKSHNIF